MNISNPAMFQGKNRKAGYFEGWYFKNVNAGQDDVLSVIPGISLDRNDPHAFVQVINGITGETRYFRFDIADFDWNRERFEVRVGKNEFSLARMKLDLAEDGFAVSGTLEFLDPVPYPSSLLSPGIMGWFSYVPFMECNHGVVSANHRIDGTLSVNGRAIDFSQGRGYIEKDWGKSFPSSWLWLQCNNFSADPCTLFVSVAKIPWLGHYFMGLIAFVYVGGKYHLFATYNGSKIENISFADRMLRIELSNRKYRLSITALQGEGGHLKAPVSGTMSRMIKESVNSTVSFTLSDADGNTIHADEGRSAGLEIMEKIFSYFQD